MNVYIVNHHWSSNGNYYPDYFVHKVGIYRTMDEAMEVVRSHPRWDYVDLFYAGDKWDYMYPDYEGLTIEEWNLDTNEHRFVYQEDCEGRTPDDEGFDPEYPLLS